MNLLLFDYMKLLIMFFTFPRFYEHSDFVFFKTKVANVIYSLVSLRNEIIILKISSSSTVFPDGVIRLCSGMNHNVKRMVASATRE